MEPQSNITISIWLSDNNETRRKIRCIYCSKVVSEVDGSVAQLTKGDAKSSGARAVIVRCHGCHTFYSFHD